MLGVTHTRTHGRTLCGALLLGAMFVAGCGEVPEDLTAANLRDLTERTQGFFLVRRDAAAGLTVAPVNGGSALCADGTTQTRCTVGTIDLTALHLTNGQSASLLEGASSSASAPTLLVRGALTQRDGAGVFVAAEAWRAPVSADVAGRFVHISAVRGGYAEQALNSFVPATTIVGLDMAACPEGDAMREAALGAADSADGVIAVGLRSVVARAGSAEPAAAFRAVQFFLPVHRDVITAPTE